MPPPSKTTPVAKPLSVYMPFPNFDSPTQATPSREMPWSSEASYQLLPDSEKGVLRPQKCAAEPHPTQTTKSINGHYPARADSERCDSWSWSSLNPLSHSASEKPRTKCEDEYKKIKHDEVEDLAPGIPTLAAILNKSFGLYRVFLPEANQILLRRIIKISKLVKELREHDASAITEDECKLITFEIEDESDEARAKLLELIEKEIYEFYDFFEKFVNIKALARPSERTHADLHNWMIFNRPLLEGEDDFIYHISDLVSSKRTNEYSSQQGNRLDDFIRTCLVGKPGSFIDGMFAQKDNTVKFGVTQYDNSRLARGRVILSVVLTVSLLLAPIFVLFLVDMPRVAMVCTVFGFVVLFAFLVALLTEGRPQDVLIGTAAYGAILAAFLGNLGSMNQCVVPTT